jgi:uncharacterized protein DUF4231
VVVENAGSAITAERTAPRSRLRWLRSDELKFPDEMSGDAARSYVLKAYERERLRRRHAGKVWSFIYLLFQAVAIAAGAAATINAASHGDQLASAAAAATATLASTVLAVLKPRESWKRQAHAAHKLLVERLRFNNGFGPYAAPQAPETLIQPAKEAQEGTISAPPTGPTSPIDPLQTYLENCEAIIRDAWAQEEASAPAPTSKTPAAPAG